MFKKILSTNSNPANAFLRIALAISILPNGYLKIIDFNNIIGILQSYYGLPWIIAFLVIIIEFFGAILLILGVFSRVNAALLGIVMIGATFYHLENGFFINWFGKQAGEGVQFHILAIGAAMASTILGAGKWSIDAVLQHKF
ncbi:hypothetical protein BKI52_32420 [marine bacterium AO1-C]|nr:hypothetical protein BKI52_32420 [marine bacterium AO1-C]